MSIYDHCVKKQDGSMASLKDYEGKVLLIVNTATGCGFTPQYEDLEAMYADYRDRGFEILDFPCNQFAGQAPGTDEEIQEFCTLTYGTDFPRFSKIDVKGENADPLYTYLISQAGFEGFDKGSKLTTVLKGMLYAQDRHYKEKPDIKWNFTKFLVDREGTVVKRFEPTADMETVREKVASLL